MKKRFFAGFVISALIGSFLALGVAGLNSCKGKVTIADSLSIAATDTMKMPCLIITKPMAQQWVDSGWTNPANPDRIKYLLFQFNSVAPANIQGNMGLVAYPGKSTSSLHSRFTLQIDAVTAKKSIVNNSIFANLMVSLDSLGIFNPDGTLTGFNYIRMTPNPLHTAPFITYDVAVVTNDVPTLMAYANPCPPCKYCPGGVCPPGIYEE